MWSRLLSVELSLKISQVEEDNSVLRDLQYLQASMLWLDIGISCGYTRKMQIAESYLQPLCTVITLLQSHMETRADFLGSSACCCF